jgi:molybdopterin converting factor small subunit
MIRLPKWRPVLAILAVAAASLLLLAPAASAAAPVPTLASTAQYKALVAYVAKLRSLQSKPTTTAQKAVYDSKLVTKHGAAVQKSSALFVRGKKVASKEAKAGTKDDSQRIRQTEAQAIDELQDSYAARFDEAANKNQQRIDALSDEYAHRLDTLKRQISDLRVKKAKTKDQARKAAIQDQISSLIDLVAAAKKEQGEDRVALTQTYEREKDQLRTEKANAIAAARAEGQEAIEALRSRIKRRYNNKVRSLQAKRESQLIDLETKLTNGRVAISLMPVTG